MPSSHEPYSQAVGNEQNVPKRSWAVSRSERNTELSMNLSVGARNIAPRVAVSTSGRSNAPRSRFMVPMRVQSLEVEALHELPWERWRLAGPSGGFRLRNLPAGRLRYLFTVARPPGAGPTRNRKWLGRVAGLRRILRGTASVHPRRRDSETRRRRRENFSGFFKRSNPLSSVAD